MRQNALSLEVSNTPLSGGASAFALVPAFMIPPAHIKFETSRIVAKRLDLNTVRLSAEDFEDLLNGPVGLVSIAELIGDASRYHTQS